MIETITFNANTYPKLQSAGFAAKFAFPFAKEICKGVGYDIGCNNLGWCLPGAIPIDPALPNCINDAYNLPTQEVDYIFSSHCLEHLKDWVGAIDYWKTKLKDGGVLFLYLPHSLQTYWRPWNNRKHIHSLEAATIQQYLYDRKWKNIFVTGFDLNSSFYVIAEK